MVPRSAATGLLRAFLGLHSAAVGTTRQCRAAERRRCVAALRWGESCWEVAKGESWAGSRAAVSWDGSVPRAGLPCWGCASPKVRTAAQLCAAPDSRGTARLSYECMG